MDSLDHDRSVLPVLGVILIVLTVSLVPLGSTTGRVSAQVEDPDNTATIIHLHPNGSATWTVNVRTHLDTDERVAEYVAFQDQFRQNKSRFLFPYRDRITGVVAHAEIATGRNMTAVGFKATTTIQEVPRRWGIVTFEFTWTNFARIQSEDIVVGDVFQAGFFLVEHDVLTIEAPSGYVITMVDPEPAEQSVGTVTWVGREDFAENRPAVQLAPHSDTTDGPEPSMIEGIRSRGIFGSMDTAGFVWGGLLILLGGGLLVTWRSGQLSSIINQLKPTSTPSGSNAGVTTDDDRVRILLKTNNNQMRQADIRDGLGWSSSKTSRVLAAMSENGQIEKIQLGRENVIKLQKTEN